MVRDVNRSNVVRRHQQILRGTKASLDVASRAPFVCTLSDIVPARRFSESLSITSRGESSVNACPPVTTTRQDDRDPVTLLHLYSLTYRQRAKMPMSFVVAMANERRGDLVVQTRGTVHPMHRHQPVHGDPAGSTLVRGSSSVACIRRKVAWRMDLQLAL